MKCGNASDVIYKDVVVIGNGPSGVALSYMLSGNLPYLTSSSHPDEMLSARLTNCIEQCLIDLDLGHLAGGLEGRSTNPVSLLLDALLQPHADMGFEIEPLVEFRKTGTEISHIVLGKGPPGGSWHDMDPNILTLSLGKWMSLPGFPFESTHKDLHRAFAAEVAQYYVEYVREMHLSKNFMNNVLVTKVQPHNKTKMGSQIISTNNSGLHGVECTKWVNEVERIDRVNLCAEPEIWGKRRNSNILSDAISYIWSRGNKKFHQTKCCKRLSEQNETSNRKLKELNGNNNERNFMPTSVSKNKKKRDSDKPIKCCDNNSESFCDTKSYSRSFSDSERIFFDGSSLSNKSSDMRNATELPYETNDENNCDCDKKNNWLVESYDIITERTVRFACKYLVLANGSGDLPNRLKISQVGKDPDWLFYDLRSLETCLDQYPYKTVTNTNPVLIVGAGLSAADAVVALRNRRVPVIHAFRNKSADLNKQLPEKMYPEYHEVHQMMQDETLSCPYYTPYPEYTPVEIDETSHTVSLISKSGNYLRVHVSYVAVLIGAKPDLSFLPELRDVGQNRNLPIDCKTNTLNIDRLSHKVSGYDNLFVVGPLAGDNFVRFIPGGALATVRELYKMNDYHKLQ